MNLILNFIGWLLFFTLPFQIAFIRNEQIVFWTMIIGFLLIIIKDTPKNLKHNERGEDL